MARPNRVVFQGEPGANSHLAIREVFPQADAVPCPTFEDCFAALTARDADLGMIPIENSLAGRVADIHHLMPEAGLHIVSPYHDGAVAQRLQPHALALVTGRDVVPIVRRTVYEDHDARRVEEIGDGDGLITIVDRPLGGIGEWKSTVTNGRQDLAVRTLLLGPDHRDPGHVTDFCLYRRQPGRCRQAFHRGPATGRFQQYPFRHAGGIIVEPG